MNKQWTIKVINNNDAGHAYREASGRQPLYPTQQHALAACEVLNAVNRQPGLFYLAVESEG